MKQIVFIIFIFIIYPNITIANQTPPIIGKWTTIDDNSGKERSVVELYQKNNKLYGRILKFYPQPGEEADPVCKECTGEHENMRIVGMDILSGLTREGQEWNNGTILDPENGEYYNCKMWLEDGKLKIRGYLLFFYRTQTWLPYNGSI